MILISGPYSSTDQEVKKQRVKAIADACILVMNTGGMSISPLLFGLSLIEKSESGMPDDYEFWQRFCRSFVAKADQVLVLNLDGWETSGGTKDEIKVAKELNIPVYLIEPLTLFKIKEL